MHISMGSDKMKLIRDALPAVLRAAAFCSSVAGTMPRIFFWFGQMNTQTLNNMIVPNHAPMPMIVVDGLDVPEAMPKVKVSSSRPCSEESSQQPVRNVNTAPQRNQSRARGAAYFV